MSGSEIRKFSEAVWYAKMAGQWCNCKVRPAKMICGHVHDLHGLCGLPTQVHRTARAQWLTYQHAAQHCM
jgi:hypothetical protein